MLYIIFLVANADELTITSKSSSSHLLVEVHWPADTTNGLHVYEDGGKAEDYSELFLDMDGNNEESKFDLNIRLNPTPDHPGMFLNRYEPIRDFFAWVKLEQIDSPSHILHEADGRHDTFLIPLETLGGVSELNILYNGDSPADGKKVSSGYQKVLITGTDEIDPQKVVDDRLATKTKQGVDKIKIEQLKVGDIAPKIHAEKWIGIEPKGMRLLAFWATWCGPCVATIPKLNTLASEGFSVIGINEQNARHIQRYQRKQKMNYPQATSSTTLTEFGLTGVPWYYILDKNNKVVWFGEKIELDNIRLIMQSN